MEKDSVRSRVSGTIQAPSSKSYAQRAVAAALLSQGETVLLNMDLCSDTRAAVSVAEALGAAVLFDGYSTYRITGGVRGGRLSPRDSTIDIGESGLSTRMFTPIASLCDIPVTITGHGSILVRPLDMMFRPLKDLGVSVKPHKAFLPVTVHGPMRGGEAHVDGSVSSQFITGLLMTLPLVENDTVLHVSKPVSIPYLDMTIDLLEKFGITVSHDGYMEFFIEGGQKYEPRAYNIEGDWSGASCLLVAGAIAGDITIKNLNPLSMQADVKIIHALSRAGAEIITARDTVEIRRRPLHGFEFNATDCPDLFPALAALAANCEGESVITGTRRLSHKESDRAETLKEEFGKMGIDIDISEEDTMRITGGQVRGAAVSSHNDHRIAMATAVAALRSDGRVTIEGAESVDKSYPDFWNDLESVRSQGEVRKTRMSNDQR